MDVFYHSLTGVAIAARLHAASPLPAVLSSLIPDIVGILPFYWFKASSIWNDPKKRTVSHLYSALMSNTFTNAIDATVYRFTHSLITAGLYSLILFTWFREIALPASLAYASHILIDVPTHNGDFATQIFYPYSHVSLKGADWVRSPQVFFLLWALLGTAYLLS